jgi:hypothetical protein
MTNILPPAYSPPNNNNNNNINNSNNNVDRLRLNLSTDQIFNGHDVHNTSNVSNGQSFQNASNGQLFPNTSNSQTFQTVSNGQIKPMQLPPPLPPTKPGWRPQHGEEEEEEEAIPSDSLYASQDSKKNGSLSWREKQFGSRPSLNGLAAWSSHGYLAKASDGTGPTKTESSDNPANGYVVLKRDQQSLSTRQPTSLPTQAPPPMTNGHHVDGDRKYFSVKGFTDMNAKHNQETETSAKYLSVDARYNSMKNLPPDIRMKLRENLRLVQEQHQLQQQQQAQQRNFSPYQAPPPPPSYPFPPAPPPRPAGMKPAPPPRLESVSQQTTTTSTAATSTTVTTTMPASAKSSSNLETSKQMSNSVSWLEWTQQLQAYIAWVNSQLRKRTDLRPVQDLRTDLQSGEVLAQLIEIICKFKIINAFFIYSLSSIYSIKAQI